MSKKLKRLTAANVIRDLDSFKDQWMHFTTADKRVRFVQVQSFEDKNFRVKDTQGHRLLLPLQDIEEIWQELQE